MKLAIISLGCPKNQADADVFTHALLKAGHETVADPAEADAILINTCGFIQSAKEEAIENILLACQYKQQNPDLRLPGRAVQKPDRIRNAGSGRRRRHRLKRRAARDS